MFLSRKALERRLSERRAVTCRLDVIASDGRHGCLLDLSGGGMRVRYDAGQDLGACERLTIELPRWLGLERELHVRGRFVWIRSLESGSVEAGFAFSDLSRRDRALLDRALDGLAEAMIEDRASPASSLPA